MRDFFDTNRTAVMDSAHCTVVNYESFFFADTADRTKFDSNVVQFAKLLTDPVSLEQFSPVSASPRSIYNDRQFYFVSDSTKAVFDSNPMMYQYPMYQMREQ